ncbi:MAG: isopentenyl-diphosphate Delta-isomerase [bacterium]|nr:isopentenyl-diphosphate Delta-isomerase [bacterium]
MLILCDTAGDQNGEASWEDAHKSPGKLHRAFSVYLFRDGKRELLVQRRSASKPLWPRILANTCCSHPRVGQTEEEVAPKRVMEECGIKSPDLSVHSTLVYQEESPNRAGSEHEFVTLLTGQVDGDIEMKPDPDEVESLEWRHVDTLIADMASKREDYAIWFQLGLHQILNLSTPDYLRPTP